MSHHYNPDWLSDDALLAGFVARRQDFAFLREELVQAPFQGSVQHYLLVGVRGAGKTTLLKRLAVAIRRDDDLKDHLIALSFPEELYQVKNLADFWWAACEALTDELDRSNQFLMADKLSETVDRVRNTDAPSNQTSDAGFKLLLQTCNELQRRPVLLVDNLDMIFERIDKSGRKLKDPHSPAYWALREALSTIESPIVVGGSVRLSEAFTSYDRAFYDFFVPKRLGKLSLGEVLEVLDRLADAQGVPELKPRLRARPGRVEALFELTGGNPRALSLIFDLLRNGPNSRAVEDFERLMDITTPYYKARIEDLSEQAQVVMHSLAVYPGDEGLRFGYTASEIGSHARLPTSTISAQLSVLESEGLVEKSTSYGRTQYRIAEQMFRLWLQMRGTRRIRQNVIGLAKFFEAMYELDELNNSLGRSAGASALADAKFAFAIAANCHTTVEKKVELESIGAARLRDHIADNGGSIDEYLPHAEGVENQFVTDAAETASDSKKRLEEKFALISKEELIVIFNEELKKESKDQSCWVALGNEFYKRAGTYDEAELAYKKAIQINAAAITPQLNYGMLLANKLGRFAEAEKTFRLVIELDASDFRGWYNLGNLLNTKLKKYEEAETAYRKAIELNKAHFKSWANLGNVLSKLEKIDAAESAYRTALELNPNVARTWVNLGNLLFSKFNRVEEAEAAYRKAVELDSNYYRAWVRLGYILSGDPQRFDDAENAYRKAIAINDQSEDVWTSLAYLLSEREDRLSEAEVACRRAISIAPTEMWSWYLLGQLVGKDNTRFAEAESAYRKAADFDRSATGPFISLGNLLLRQTGRQLEAEDAYRNAIERDPQNSYWAWVWLGSLLADSPSRYGEAETAFRKALELRPQGFWPITGLASLLSGKLNRRSDAELVYRNALAHGEEEPRIWTFWANFLAEDPQNNDEAEIAYRKVVELNPQASEAYMDLADFLFERRRNLDESEGLYRKALVIDPSKTNTWIGLGRVLSKDKTRQKEAEEVFRQAIERSGKDVSPMVHFAIALQIWGRLDDAEEILRDAINVDPGSGWAHAALAAILNERGLFEEAEQELRASIENDPNVPWPWEMLGILFGIELKRYEEAEHAFKRAIEINPDIVHVWANFGIVLESAGRFDEAAETFEKAAELQATSMAPEFALNEWYARGRLARARSTIVSKDLTGLANLLSDIIRNVDDPARLLVSNVFVEGFLGDALKSEVAESVLVTMKNVGYERFARPLLLAYEAIIEKKQGMIFEIEPELQDATKKMYERLIEIDGGSA